MTKLIWSYISISLPLVTALKQVDSIVVVNKSVVISKSMSVLMAMRRGFCANRFRVFLEPMRAKNKEWPTNQHPESEDHVTFRLVDCF